MPVIAIVDDDEAMRDALCELIEVMGFSTEAFDCAAAFLAGDTPERFDCLITDVRMPGIDGIELQRRLRALGCTIPVLMITSAPDPAGRARALDGGACAYLAKPVDDSALLDHLRSALGHDEGPGEEVNGEKSSGG
ncbi:response regulator transcription factor [Inquilinus limosus]|uniref:response regulator transcription factor n=1 Tax=Inquilinus limosus TaxID=171674 RepID=UPI003F5CDA58